MDWQKDPVLMEMQGNIRCLAWAVFVLFVIVCFVLCLHSRSISPEMHPTVAAQADAEWREIGRRIDSLEKPTPSQPAGTSVSLAYDPDVFAIDSQGRLTLKVGPSQRPDQCVTVTTPAIVDTRRLGETR